MKKVVNIIYIEVNVEAQINANKLSLFFVLTSKFSW